MTFQVGIARYGLSRGRVAAGVVADFFALTQASAAKVVLLPNAFGHLAGSGGQVSSSPEERASTLIYPEMRMVWPGRPRSRAAFTATGRYCV